MDIKILDSWLRDYLETKAAPAKIAEALGLSGPSVEKIEKAGGDFIYNIEITTNRIDAISVYGIAREASAILPRFRIPTRFKKIIPNSQSFNFTNKVSYLSASVDSALCPRFTAVLIKNVSVGPSSDYISNRLEKSGVRSLNNVVDISNYIMLALGQPVHTFDYNKIAGAKMLLRQSKKGESITTLDGKSFSLPGGDIVIEDGEGKLIDLAGVMGGNLSMVSKDTKNVLLFVQTYNPAQIRNTSMALAQRTLASTIFEKGIDPEMVAHAILFGIKLFETECKGTAEKEILNIYPKPFKSFTISLTQEQISESLGAEIPKSEISKILASLEFESLWKGNKLEVVPPSFRSRDVIEGIDVIEEIARIYGYHNLPSHLMESGIPEEPKDTYFDFEEKVKDILVGFGGSEIYTLSLVSQGFTRGAALKLKNPLGRESEYLRTSLMPSLVSAARANTSSQSFQLFEIANVYLPRAGELPEERPILAGIFTNYDYRKAKGIVEAFFTRLGVKADFSAHDDNDFSPTRAAQITSDGKNIGKIGVTDEGFIYWEITLKELHKLSDKNISYKEISKFPSQIEDITFAFPEKTKIGEVVSFISSVNGVEKAEFIDVFENSHTFRIWFHSDKKTLTDEEVEKIRAGILASVKTKFGGMVKG